MAKIGQSTTKTTREMTTSYPASARSVKNFLHDAPENAEVLFLVRTPGPMYDTEPTTLTVSYSFEEED